MSDEQGRVMGALSLMTAQPFSRAMSHSLEPTAGFVAAVLASSGHRSPITMAAVGQLFAVHLVRFQRPPGFNETKVVYFAPPPLITPSMIMWLISGVLALHHLITRPALIMTASPLKDA